VNINSKIFISIAFVLVSLVILTFAGRFFLASISNTSLIVKEIICSTNSDCGTSGLMGNLFCQGNDVYQNYITYICNNPSTELSSCTNSITAQLQTTCNSSQICSDGNCTIAAQNHSPAGGLSYYPTTISIITPTISEEQQTFLPNSAEVQSEKQPEVITENHIDNTTQNQPNTQPTNISESPIEENPPTNSSASINLASSAIASLSQKIPAFGNILSNLNIDSPEDIENLQNYNIFLPGLKTITGSNFSNLTPEQKNKIPTEIVFILLGDKNIDAAVKLDASKSASALESVNVLVGKPMHLLVKPELGVKAVTGHVLFQSSDLLNSNQNFSVLKFEYSDDNNDGIYVANINSPAVMGQYQIVTSINYKDETLGQKEIRTTTLVDPDGYIYEKIGDEELRINGAEISLYQLNNKNQYELWQADIYGQENPQATDTTGNYSFLVPKGTYYLTVKAPGYYSYQSDAFSVIEGKEVHSNIALEKEPNFTLFLNWNSILITILSCFTAYNFYENIKRKKVIANKTRI